jgi:hypothetical protein
MFFSDPYNCINLHLCLVLVSWCVDYASNFTLILLILLDVLLSAFLSDISCSSALDEWYNRGDGLSLDFEFALAA